MVRLKAVFLDMGGTLLDMQSDKYSHLRVLEETKARYGLEVSVNDLHVRFVDYLDRFQESQSKRWRSVLGLTEEAFREEMARLGIDAQNRDTDWFLKTYKATYRKGVKLAAGAMDAVRGAKLLGLHVGVVSDADEEWANLILDSLRIRPLLDSITTSESVGVGKPNPKIFVSALRKAKCEPQEAVHVGDSLERDVRGAKAVGIRTVHVAAAPSTEADYHVKTVAELLPVLRQLAGATQ